LGVLQKPTKNSLQKAVIVPKSYSTCAADPRNMNAERLHAIANALHKEMAAVQTAAKIEELCTSLEQVVHQNNFPQFQEGLATNLSNVYISLTNCYSDSFSPAWKQLLSEIGGTPYFGQSLKSAVEEIFRRNQITPAVALKELEQLAHKIKAFQQELEHMLAAFELFNIADEKLEPGECEIGMLIPRSAVDNNLNGFAQELKELILVLNTFSEVASGKPDALILKTISSSDLTVYLHAFPPFAACLALAVERIVALYKQLLEIRKIRGELLKQGVPDKQTAGIEEHANNLMGNGIETVTFEILEKFYQGKDGHRRNELGNAVRVSLNRIANRIDRGYNIEVRVEPLKESAQDNEEAKKTAEQICTIQGASKNMQFIKLEGVPILKLPENAEKQKTKKE
jgi:hypothetical protein